MSQSPWQSVNSRQITRKEFLTIAGFAVATAFGLGGLIRELQSHALTTTIAEEPENGSAAGVVTVLSDASAAGGRAVKFGPGSTLQPDYNDDFMTFDSSRWYPCYPYNLGGAVDEGSKGSWNAGTSALNGSVYSPYTIVADTSTNSGSLLRISCRRTTAAEKVSTAGKDWVGGIMISHGGWTNGYVEWRARFPAAGNGAGMWPALWLFGQTQSSATQQKASRGLSEMDMLEIFGVPGTWNSTVHDVNSAGAVSNDRRYTGPTDTGWHTYGIEWNGSSVLNFYYDHLLKSSATTTEAANFNGQSMCARMNYSVTDSVSWAGAHTNATTPNTLYFDVDYFKHYLTKPF